MNNNIFKALFYCIWAIVLYSIPLMSSEAEYPNRFLIQEDSDFSIFNIFNEEKTEALGRVEFSDGSQINFYNGNGEKKFINQHTSLYNSAGKGLAEIRLASDKKKTALKKMFSKEPTLMEIFINRKTPILKVETEKDDNNFVFRDPETNKILMIATWSWENTSTLLGLSSRPVQNWLVTIVDRSLIQKKKIPYVFFVWALLKHSQKHLQPPSVGIMRPIRLKRSS